VHFGPGRRRAGSAGQQARARNGEAEGEGKATGHHAESTAGGQPAASAWCAVTSHRRCLRPVIGRLALVITAKVLGLMRLEEGRQWESCGRVARPLVEIFLHGLAKEGT